MQNFGLCPLYFIDAINLLTEFLPEVSSCFSWQAMLRRCLLVMSNDFSLNKINIAIHGEMLGKFLFSEHFVFPEAI